MNKEKCLECFIIRVEKKPPLHFKPVFFISSSPLNSFTLFTALHEKLNHSVPSHSRGKTLIFSRLHFVLMQRDSSVLYSQALFLTNGPQALHSQHLYSLSLRSKMSKPLVSSDLDLPSEMDLDIWREEGINWMAWCCNSNRKSKDSVDVILAYCYILQSATLFMTVLTLAKH